MAESVGQTAWVPMQFLCLVAVFATEQFPSCYHTSASLSVDSSTRFIGVFCELINIHTKCVYLSVSCCD